MQVLWPKICSQVRRTRIKIPRGFTNESLASRRDLVNRHERSFHPHADGLSLSERISPVNDHNDISMFEIPNLPTPPSQTSETSSEKAHSHTRSPYNAEPNLNMSLEMLSPHSDTMPHHGLSDDTGEMRPNPISEESPGVGSLVAAHQRIDDTLLHLSVTKQSTSLDDPYNPKNANLPSGSLDFGGKGEWYASNVTGSVTGYEEWVPPSGIGITDLPLDVYEDQNIFPDDFDLITIDSMALNHAALDADLSTYLNHPKQGPWDQKSGHHTQSPAFQQDAFPESASLPIEASTLNVSIADAGSPGILSRMPSLLKETPRKTLTPPIIDENVYYAIMSSVRLQVSTTADMDPLISLQEMQQFLKCYLICFHKHCPIIHLPSLDLETVPCHLILAMCAIGALYRLRRKTAHDLWQCATQICDRVLMAEIPKCGCQVADKTRKEMRLDTNGDPLTTSAILNMQCKLLVTWFCVFSGDMTQHAISASGFWATV